ncbi:hypothetical protein CR513_01395, partial [Mucuna pruriens]
VLLSALVVPSFEEAESCFDLRSDDQLNTYQIGAIARDTCSVFPKNTLSRIRKSKSMHVGHTSDSFSSILETNKFEIKPDFANNPLYEPELMENNIKTLKEMATLNVLYQPWCIQYPQLELA